MYIQNANFINYRNLKNSTLELGHGFWTVLGSNGQGKSNLLELVAVLASGKSFRTERDRELITLSESWMSAEGLFIREQRHQVDLGIRITDVSKQLLVNKTPVGRLARYVTEAACVTFCAEDVNIILGEPTLRREFMNDALSQISQGYVQDYSRFRRSLEQKNRTLKLLKERGGSPDVLDVWDEQISQYGGRVCARREKFIRQLSVATSELYQSLCGSAESIELKYAPGVPQPESLDQWPQVLREAMLARRSDELIRCMSLVGPHRDDLAIMVDGKPARSFASRGQARTAALAIRLAQADHARSRLNEYPILLMDDVFTELDESRRAFLADAAACAEQVFVSSASPSDLPERGALTQNRIVVSDGNIEIQA